MSQNHNLAWSISEEVAVASSLSMISKPGSISLALITSLKRTSTSLAVMLSVTENFIGHQPFSNFINVQKCSENSKYTNIMHGTSDLPRERKS